MTPLFLVAGTFFPLNTLPHWAQVLGELNPLHHCVQLVRDFVFMNVSWVDALRVGYLILSRSCCGGSRSTRWSGS